MQGGRGDPTPLGEQEVQHGAVSRFDAVEVSPRGLDGTRMGAGQGSPPKTTLRPPTANNSFTAIFEVGLSEPLGESMGPLPTLRPRLCVGMVTRRRHTPRIREANLLIGQGAAWSANSLVSR